MSNPTRIRTQLHALDQLHQLITGRYQPFIKSVRLTLAENDGYPKTASGADRSGSSSGGPPSSSTERAAVANLDGGRISATRDLTEVADLLGAAAIAYKGVLEVFERYVQGLSDADRRRLQCVGDGTPEGATCTAYASPNHGGMCAACYMRKRRRDKNNAA
jgi:hypothetical protein